MREFVVRGCWGLRVNATSCLWRFLFSRVLAVVSGTPKAASLINFYNSIGDTDALGRIVALHHACQMKAYAAQSLLAWESHTSREERAVDQEKCTHHALLRKAIFECSSLKDKTFEAGTILPWSAASTMPVDIAPLRSCLTEAMTIRDQIESQWRTDAIDLRVALAKACPDWEAHENTILQDEAAEVRKLLLTNPDYQKLGPLSAKLKMVTTLLLKLQNDGCGRWFSVEEFQSCEHAHVLGSKTVVAILV